MKRAGWWLAAAVVLSGASVAGAQDGPQCERVQRGRRTEIVCSEVQIEGSSPRPYVLLGRARARHEPRALDREMAREIPRTVRRTDGPF
jgi:hypothetical protein